MESLCISALVALGIIALALALAPLVALSLVLAGSYDPQDYRDL